MYSIFLPFAAVVVDLCVAYIYFKVGQLGTLDVCVTTVYFKSTRVFYPLTFIILIVITTILLLSTTGGLEEGQQH